MGQSRGVVSAIKSRVEIKGYGAAQKLLRLLTVSIPLIAEG